MRVVFFVLLICLFPLFIFCQNSPVGDLWKFAAQESFSANRSPVARESSITNMESAIKIPANMLLNPGIMKELIKKLPQENTPELLRKPEHMINRPADNGCRDTSFSRLVGVHNGSLYARSATRTYDGGILVPIELYDTTRLPSPWGKSYGILVKLDGDGNVLWVKQFEKTSGPGNDLFTIYKAFELPNHDIICAGYQGITSSMVYYTPVYRLTSTGNLIWKNMLRSNIGLFNSPPGSFWLRVTGAAEGLNGDVILSGTLSSNVSYGVIETVIRLDSNGQLVWDANYGNHGVDGSYRFGAVGVTAFVKNGQIILIGSSRGNNIGMGTPPSVNFFTLDYNTGNLVAKRFYKPQYQDPWEVLYKSFNSFSCKVTLLSNGHILFYGTLNSDQLNMTVDRYHFGVLEFDTAFNLLDAYLIQSTIKTNVYNNLLHFDPSGKGVLSLLEYISPYEANVFFAAFHGKQFQHQRKSHYVDAGMPGLNDFCYLDDGGYAYIQTYYQSQPVGKSYFEVRKMHNSDTSTVCLGKDTLPFHFAPLNIVEDSNDYYWDPNDPNYMVAYAHSISLTDTISTSFVNPCSQVNYCDSVKISGNPVVCGSGTSVVFTGVKNSGCGAIVQWNIDPLAVDSLKTLNDSSVRIWFKNINWVGKLYASISGSSCYAPAMDSMTVTVITSPVLNLGPDTVICGQNTMILHAGNTFFSYLWQDGSTDSTYTVSFPGTYYVTATDLCSNSLSDTIHITAASFPFTIGTDTIRCNNDTLRLTATSGFINYQWLNNYNINTTSGQSVSVYPAVDTFYYATAEKWPGCMVKDTIHITVHTSPRIFLGADTSLCAGQILVLDAGPGFVSYQWNTGSTVQQITVNQPGTYSIKATVASGCISTDTLKLLNVSSPPVFSLGSDTTLCSGTTYRYSINLPNVSYLWQDGNTSGQYTVTNAGQYILTVTQTGCAASDTVLVAYKPAPVVNLGKDSSICEGNTYLLDASYPGASYLWQDGSVSPKFLVDHAGIYSITSELNGCRVFDTVAIAYISKPVFELGNDTVICKGQTILLKPLLNAPVNYLWQDGANTAVYKVTRPGSFSLQASNSCGSYTDNILVNMGICELFMPNSFTPNDDGINDVFKVKYPFPVREFNFSVFNRYGQKLFETNDMRTGWNGTYKSDKQPAGVYVWVIKITGLNGFAEITTGTVNIIR